MSVCAFISNPIDNSETGSNMIPFASEAFFKKVWLAGATEMQLEWIPLFSNGTDVTVKDLPSILEEIATLKNWAEQNISKEDYEQLKRRTDFITQALPKLFLREGILVFIG